VNVRTRLGAVLAATQHNTIVRKASKIYFKIVANIVDAAQILPSRGQFGQSALFAEITC
jgi:hypothetical protein